MREDTIANGSLTHLARQMEDRQIGTSAVVKDAPPYSGQRLREPSGRKKLTPDFGRPFEIEGDPASGQASCIAHPCAMAAKRVQYQSK